MYGNVELIELTKLLRIGIATVREIANRRPEDYDALVSIVERAEAIARDLDEITKYRDAAEQLQ